MIDVKSYTTARRRAPWAQKIVKVEGGFLAFDSIVGFHIWRRQK